MTTFTISRDAMGPFATTGQLLAGDISLYTLEDPWLDNQIGVSCIPLGTYPVIIDQSNRFKRPMPHIESVPGRTGIRVHSGNTTADTEGCVLVGMSRDGATILHSVDAFKLFYEWLSNALLDGPVQVEVALVG